MSIVILKAPVTRKDLNLIKEDYEEYIKLVVDIEKGIVAAGGEWHSDAEKALLASGSMQKDLWGGGIDLSTGQVDYISLINTRPNVNNSQELSDRVLREKMLVIINKVFEKYVKQG